MKLGGSRSAHHIGALVQSVLGEDAAGAFAEELVLSELEEVLDEVASEADLSLDDLSPDDSLLVDLLFAPGLRLSVL